MRRVVVVVDDVDDEQQTGCTDAILHVKKRSHIARDVQVMTWDPHANFRKMHRTDTSNDTDGRCSSSLNNIIRLLRSY
jgi:hypothetical protein